MGTAAPAPLELQDAEVQRRGGDRGGCCGGAGAGVPGTADVHGPGEHVVVPAAGGGAVV